MRYSIISSSAFCIFKQYIEPTAVGLTTEGDLSGVKSMIASPPTAERNSAPEARVYGCKGGRGGGEDKDWESEDDWEMATAM